MAMTQQKQELTLQSIAWTVSQLATPKLKLSYIVGQSLKWQHIVNTNSWSQRIHLTPGNIRELHVLVVVHVEGLFEVLDEGCLLLALGVAPDHMQDAVHYLHIELVQLKVAIG